MKALLRFLVLGALLHAGARLLPPRADPVVLSAAQVQSWRSDWWRETGRLPTPAQERAGLQQIADEEALLREALRLGLSRRDPVARSRLVQNMRFAQPHAARSDAELLDDAVALGMDRRDAVVRRRLVQAMEQRLAAEIVVSDAEVDAYVTAHRARYALPVRFGFRHAFFSADAPDAAARAEAQRGHAEPRGDPFLLGSSIAPQPLEQIARRFGDDFARALPGLPQGQWAGPLASAYGLHLVKVERVDAASVSPQQVREQARYALVEERERARVRGALTELRRRYPLRVEALALAEAQ